VVQKAKAIIGAQSRFEKFVTAKENWGSRQIGG
jgi:hypothetical protein